MRDAVILFAKAPVEGNVKTRLARRVSLAAAAALHRAFVRDMIESLGRLDADLSIAADSIGAWEELGLPVVSQRGSDLGERIRNAVVDSLAEGRAACAIVGSDAPTLPPSHVEGLLASRSDVTLGPADDGGFYAIACRRTAQGMFDGVEWSTAETLGQTRAALTRAGLTVSLGPSWFDVDTPDDLERLMSGDLPTHTRRWREAQLAAR